MRQDQVIRWDEKDLAGLGEPHPHHHRVLESIVNLRTAKRKAGRERCKNENEGRRDGFKERMAAMRF